MTYAVIFEKGPRSWGAWVPDIPGVITVGDTRGEVEQLIQEAIEFHLHGLRKRGPGNPHANQLCGIGRSPTFRRRLLRSATIMRSEGSG